MQLPSLGTRSQPTNNAVFSGAGMKIPQLKDYIPEHSEMYLARWFEENPVLLRITRARSSKFGDYRGTSKNLPARISVNHNLNRYDFLLTLVHEMAHHEVCAVSSSYLTGFRFSKRKKSAAPHGTEWKNKYRRLMGPLLNESVFPPDLLPLVREYFENPGSSARTGKQLTQALKVYDEPDGLIFIEQVPENGVFTIPAGRSFRKGEKLRKRYRCVCLENGKIYLISPTAKVSLAKSG